MKIRVLALILILLTIAGSTSSVPSSVATSVVEGFDIRTDKEEYQFGELVTVYVEAPWSELAPEIHLQKEACYPDDPNLNDPFSCPQWYNLIVHTPPGNPYGSTYQLLGEYDPSRDVILCAGIGFGPPRAYIDVFKAGYYGGVSFTIQGASGKIWGPVNNLHERFYGLAGVHRIELVKCTWFPHPEECPEDQRKGCYRAHSGEGTCCVGDVLAYAEFSVVSGLAQTQTSAASATTAITGKASRVPLGMYVDTWSGDLWENEKLDRLIMGLSGHGVKTIYVDVFSPTGEARGQFRIKPKGNLADFGDFEEADFDKTIDLNYLIGKAHEADMEVHAKIDCFGWGNTKVSPTSMEHQYYLLRVVWYLVSTFDLDGIQLDYVRYVGMKANGDTSTITAFVGRVYDIIEQNRPMKLSAAVKPASSQGLLDGFLGEILRSLGIGPSCDGSDPTWLWGEYNIIRYCYGQDYEKMSGYLDFISPMAYHIEGEFGRTDPGAVTRFVKGKVGGLPVVPILQAYGGATKDDLRDALQKALNSEPDGISLFVYQSISNGEWCVIDEAVLGTPCLDS